MHSELIEYFRLDDLETGILQKNKRYIRAHKDFPVKEVATLSNQIDLLKTLNDHLKYNSQVSETEKWATIKSLSDEIKLFFIDIAKVGKDNVQLDLVLNASELGLLPFELLLDENNQPIFANPDKQLVLTRRIRQEFMATEENWPLSPKVLFAFANAGYASPVKVPSKTHLEALNWALKPWGGIANKKVLTVLEEANFEDLSNTLNEAAESGQPFTHVHILAHGKLIFDENKPYDFEYGIAFQDKTEQATKTIQIKTLFQDLKRKPFLVNYMVCDGACFSNALKPDKNPVQVTHRAGVPIVLGSQFPLSVDGSSLITNILYNDFFTGKDIRSTLYRIRHELFEKRAEHHDWVSLVSYVRLPEGYDDYLSDVALKYKMTHLKTIRQKTEDILKQENPSADDFEEYIFDLKRNIDALEEQLNKVINKDLYLENAGLLGSAYKRLAELYFYKSKTIDKNPKTSLDAQHEYIKKAREYYKKASDQNLSHHWSTTQFLCLDVVITGYNSNPDYWYATRQAVGNALRQESEIWAYGSLIELFLLIEANAIPDIRDNILSALTQLISRSKKAEDEFPILSTYQQLSRYLDWWTKDNGFPIDNKLLASDAGFIKSLTGQLKNAMNM